MILTNIDLSQPLTDHPFWRDVRGVWLPIGNLAGKTGTGCGTLYDLGPYHLNATQDTSTNRPIYRASTDGMAVDFDGSDDFLDIGDQKCLDLTSSGLTVLHWVWRDTILNDVWTIQKRGSGTWGTQAGWQVSWFDDSPRMRNTGYDDGSGNYIYFTSGDDVAASVWQHWSVVFNPANLDLKAYLNGVDCNYTYAASSSLTPTTTTRHAAIGSYWNDASTQGQFLDGQLRDVIVLARVLSDDEIAFAYDQSLRGYPELIAQTTGRLTCYITNNPIGFASNVPA